MRENERICVDAQDDATDLMPAISNKEIPANFYDGEITDGTMVDCHEIDIVAV